MSAKDFKQHMLNELIELERLIRNDCGRDNGLDTSYEPEELKWFEKLHELQELCEGNNINASDSKLPLCGVINCTDLEPDFIEALNQLIDTQRKPNKKRF